MRRNWKSKYKVWRVFRVTVSGFFLHELRFWNTKSENSPEIRREIAEKSRRANRDNAVDPADQKVKKRSPKLFSEGGRPYSLNMPKLDFTFHDEADRYELDLFIHK